MSVFYSHATSITFTAPMAVSRPRIIQRKYLGLHCKLNSQCRFCPVTKTDQSSLMAVADNMIWCVAGE